MPPIPALRLARPLLGVTLMGVWAVACSSAAPPPASPAAPTALAPSSAPRASSDAPPSLAPVVEPDDAVLQLRPYRQAFEGRLVGEWQRLLMTLEAQSRPPIGHVVVTLGHPSGGPPYRTVTVGFGRRAQPHHFGTTPRYVEFLAESSRQGEAIRETLSRLGRYLHAPDRPISVRFQAYDAIRVDEPIFGERFFVLVPGGEITIGQRLTITLLRVIPMDEENFIHMNMRGDGAIRAWWSEHRGSGELLRRWDGVLDRMSSTLVSLASRGEE